MKIDKFTKLKNGMYKLTLNDKEIKIHEDLILKYELLLNRNIDDNLLKKLELENKKYEGYNLAIKYLKTRQRSKKEIYEYLNKKEIVRKYIDEIIDLLINQGYLNDEFYISSYIHDKILLSSDGPLKIKKYLLNNNLDSELVNNKMLEFTEELEIERINKIISKLIKSNNKSNYNFKIKVKNYLIDLGYNIDLVNREVSKINIDDSTLFEKEKDKLYKKYSKKYSGYELDMKVKQGLFAKGYRN